MDRLIITSSSTKSIYTDQPVLINGNGLHIAHLIITQSGTFNAQIDQPYNIPYIAELRGNDCTIAKITIVGFANDEDVGEWMTTCCSGLLVSGDNNIIAEIEADHVHVPYMATGPSNRLLSGHVTHISGDGFNLCADGNLLCNYNIAGMLAVFPYHIYHRDVGMIYAQDGGVLRNCHAYNVTLSSTGHPWEEAPQGFLADHRTENCSIANWDIPEVHEEHGASWADAHDCQVINLTSNGALRWDRKSEGVCSPAERNNICM